MPHRIVPCCGFLLPTLHLVPFTLLPLLNIPKYPALMATTYEFAGIATSEA